MTELSDELLVAYVDGQLARKQTRAVEKVLDQDDVIAARVEALKHAHDRLEAAFEAILAGEEVDVSAASAPPRDGIFIEWRIVKRTLAALGIAAALLLAAIGYGWPLSLQGFSPVSSTATHTLPILSWQEEAARAHALLSRASVEVGLEGQGNPDFVRFQLAEILGSDLKLPNLEPQGFRFARAQVLRIGGAPFTQILYLGSEGAPLALYARKGDGAETLSSERYGPINGVTWTEGGTAYLLAGEAEDALLMRIATRVKLEPVAPLNTARKPHTPVNSALDDR
ncbi:MAG: anti-sigma factor family protein [Methyloceanibacter sp.]|uniref:anti-sigma factor family protein n=1 Tax=Methyloceanibacter sp. TaxID=1965321 RepID=UPI003D6D3E25